MIRIGFTRSLRSLRSSSLNHKNLYSTNSFNYEIVQPQTYNLIKRTFPDDIQLPIYSKDGIINDFIIFEDKIFNYKDLSRDSNVIQGVRDACEIARDILRNVKEFIKPGLKGEEIDEFVYQQCLLKKCYPSPLGYDGFPKCLTLSVNNVCVHGIPDQRELKPSDIVKVDISIFYKGFHGDTANTFLIDNKRAIGYNELNSDLVDSGIIDSIGLNLIRTAKKCLDKGIAVCKAGVSLNDIGHAIDQVARENGFNVVPSVCGHSIGEYIHGLPHIVHCPYDDYPPGEDVLLENMLITIEPVICEFEPDAELLEDGWTVCTEDSGRTCQFEHTILVKKDRSEILTNF